MERRFFHGSIDAADLANRLLAEFNRGNLRAQALGEADKTMVQVTTNPGALSGGQTALTVIIQHVEDGLMVELGEQAWLGVAASLGVSALAALRNPFHLLGRLDDIAQDIENLQLSERIWKTVEQSATALGASREFSERLSRVVCEYCWTANPLTESACIACGAPLGKGLPIACGNCGYAVKPNENKCPNCGQLIRLAVL
jgi:hypothetical protein